MIGLKIGLGNLFVTASACGHHIQAERVLVRAVNGMSGVAIIADWKRLAVSADLLGMDAVLELLLDAVMALAARVGHVIRVHTRSRVTSGQDMVSSMATGASRGHCQAVLEQGSVNALGVVGDDLVLGSGVADGGFVALAVAARAEVGNIDRKGRRLRILFADCLLYTSRCV